jgi:hypothetical protein
MLKLIRNLLVAMINATFLLGAMCLFLAVTLTGNLLALDAMVQSTLSSVAPIRRDLTDTKDALTQLNHDMRQLYLSPNVVNQDALVAIEDQLKHLNARLTTIEKEAAEIATLPDRAMDVAIDALADHLKSRKPPAVD